MEIAKFLRDKGKEAGIKINVEQSQKFETYLKLLLEWNEKINLTAITAQEEIVTKHFIDSLLMLKAYNIKQGAKLIDVGTGAGFPAIPIKIMRPDIEITLLDGLNKRLKFLQIVADELGVEVKCVHKRAEEGGRLHEMREKYDVATARAVAKMNTLCEYCIPFVKMKGVFIAMKGPALKEEMVEAKNAIEILGCEVIKSESFVLPDEEKSEREISVLQKFSFTPKEYPRHGNKISKDPIV